MTLTDIINIALPYAGAIVTIVIYMKTVGANKTKEHNECIEKIKLDITHHGLDQTKFQLNHEKLADSMEQRFKHLESKVNQFENIVPEVQALKLKMESYSQKIDNLIESVKEGKADNKDTIKEIKEMIRTQVQTHIP